jgi:hypothetical protein
MIRDDNTVLADMVKMNAALLQKCLVSQNRAIFIAAIENLKYSPFVKVISFIGTLQTISESL